MKNLIHLIYSSSATREISDDELINLLTKARAKNARLGITGMLLFEKNSFFQVLEGEAENVDALYQEIAKDDRHASIVVIIREPISKRTFGDWTMGYSKFAPEELQDISKSVFGFNDFFTSGSSFSQLNQGRAKKLLSAFQSGRWRAKINNVAPRSETDRVAQPVSATPQKVSFAFQAIFDASNRNIMSYEALIRGQSNESFDQVLPIIDEREWFQFDTNSRAIAISLAAKLGLKCNLNLNYMARYVEDARAAIRSSLDAAEHNGIDPQRIILEIDQDRLLGDFDHFAKIIDEYRGAGLRISISHFGAGRAGLNLLEPLHPEMISLNAQLVRSIDSIGSRQAIVGGVIQTCNDLGIDIIAKHIETADELQWLYASGISLFQGDFISPPAFEQLPVNINFPNMD